MSATKARKEIRKLANSNSNWRLPAMMLAHPRVPSGLDEADVAKAWPSHKSDYRMLGIDSRNEVAAPDKQYSFEEDSRAFRQLSDAANKSDFSDGPFGEKIIHTDKAIKRALAFEDSIANLDTLFREEIRETVIEGARKNQIARDAATVINVDRQRGDHPRGPDDEFAPEVGEGAAIEDKAGRHDTVEWNTTKYGRGMAATDELLNQSLVDVIAQNMEHLGRQAENALNRQFVTTLVEDAGDTVDASGEDNRGWAAINEAIHQVELNDFMPDSVVQHPTFTKTLFDTAENNALIPFANEFGDDEGIRDRVAFPLLGLEGFRASNGMLDPASSDTWDYTGNDETGGVVYDRDNVGIYLFRDVEMKEYEDPIRDLEGINVRMESDVVLQQPDSAVAIDYGTA
ncbi:hypothetical protein [Halorubrum tailed virus BLv36]|nr:hypothetical protein [Halorubrum tailed virus BLv36]